MTSPHIVDVSQADFAQRVLEASRKRPVLVDFWAPWCAPCRMLAPILERLAEEYADKLIVAKVNTDAEQELAMAYHIRGIPAVKLFRNGAMVGEFVGVQPEAAIRALVDRFVPTEADETIERALALAASGAAEEAAALLRALLERDANNDRAKIALATVWCDRSAGAHDAARLAECERLLDSLSIRAAGEPEVERLRFRLGLRRAAAEATRAGAERDLAANPDDLRARYRLAAHLALAGDYEKALEHLLEIVRRDRKFGDDAGRKAMVGIFRLLGQQHPLVNQYRAALSRTLA